jgi:hypothetical protein
MKPEIATILLDGSYGQREMTDEEYAEYEAVLHSGSSVVVQESE